MKAGSSLLLALSLTLSLVLVSSAAVADTPRGSYIEVDPSTVTLWDPSGGPQANGKLFLNRCAGGCVVTPGQNSSLGDRSSIIGGTSRQLAAYAHGDESWNELVKCVEGIFEPFGIEVTDVPPTGAHHEVMIAGTPQQLGMQSGILGVSPATCGIIDNSLTFVFANVTASIPDLCWAAAQEPAHSWGLDHQMLCEDPMTYLTSPCGNSKFAFQDVASPCGENSNRSCRCGGSTQNSFQKISQIFDVDGGDAPEMAIVRPTEGQVVRPFFPIEVQAVDASPFGAVEVYLNGALHATSEFQPFIFNAPEDIADGPVMIEVRATDVHGATGTATVNATVGDPDTDPDNPGGDTGGGCQVTSGSGGRAGLSAPLAALVFGLAMGRFRRRRRG